MRGSTPVSPCREDVRRQNLLQLVDDVADLQILGFAHGGREIRPEIAQQLLPVQLAVGDFVQLLFQVGREVIGDIAVEEAVEEGGDQPALVFGHEALAVHLHIGAVAQGGDDRGIGRGPADAQLFQLLDQAGFGIARRRLGEMLRRIDAFDIGLVAGGDLGQPGAILVGCRRPGLPDTGSRKPSNRVTVPVARSTIFLSAETTSTVVRSCSADSIWLATARFQISS